MIYFADQSLWRYVRDNTDKYFYRSFLSTISIGSPIDSDILPPPDIQKFYIEQDMEQFRRSYMGYMNTYGAHMAIMDMMMDNYYNPDVVILTDLQNTFASNVVECITAYIYSRYGYRCTIVYDVDDLVNTKVHDELPAMYYPVFYADKRWYIMETMDPQMIMNNMDDIEDMSNGR